MVAPQNRFAPSPAATVRLGDQTVPARINAPDLLTLAGRVLDIMARFEAVRAGRKPWQAKGNCPVCRSGSVHYIYAGPKAIRMWCDGDGCNVRMIA